MKQCNFLQTSNAHEHNYITTKNWTFFLQWPCPLQIVNLAIVFTAKAFLRWTAGLCRMYIWLIFLSIHVFLFLSCNEQNIKRCNNKKGKRPWPFLFSRALLFSDCNSNKSLHCSTFFCSTLYNVKHNIGPPYDTQSTKIQGTLF